MNGQTIAFVGLGANLGDAAASVRAAIDALDVLPQTRLLRASRLYRTPAWGVEQSTTKQQPDFVNAAAMLETSAGAGELLHELLGIERRFGRVRTPAGHWEPRTLDLDLLAFGQRIIDEPNLRVPHPYMHRRGFVLLPLLEIAPDFDIPGFGPARDAASALPQDEIRNIHPISVDNSRP